MGKALWLLLYGAALCVAGWSLFLIVSEEPAGSGRGMGPGLGFAIALLFAVSSGAVALGVLAVLYFKYALRWPIAGVPLMALAVALAIAIPHAVRARNERRDAELVEALRANDVARVQRLAADRDVYGGHASPRDPIVVALQSANVVTLAALFDAARAIDHRVLLGLIVHVADNRDPQVLPFLLTRTHAAIERAPTALAPLLDAFVRKGNVEAERAILSAVPPSAAPDRQLLLNGALFTAARTGQLESATYLLDEGGDARATRSGLNLLDAICDEGWYSAATPQVARLLLEKGADPNGQREVAPPPLIALADARDLAAAANARQLFLALVDGGARLDLAYRNRMSAADRLAAKGLTVDQLRTMR